MKLPRLLTLHGSTSNPFVDVAVGDPEAARLLAVAVATAHNGEEVYAALRAFARLFGRTPQRLSGYLTGRLMLGADGEALDRDLLAPYAFAFLGEEIDARDVAWTVERYPGFLAAVAS